MRVLQEVENSRGNVLLFIDEVHTLIGAGAVQPHPLLLHLGVILPHFVVPPKS